MKIEGNLKHKTDMQIKTILHLCADVGSDTAPYQDDQNYNVILVGKDIGVENYEPPKNVHGVFANPVCTDFSIAKNANAKHNGEDGMGMVNHCLRIINQCNPKFWVLENPATGKLKNHLGKPVFSYEPWWYGSPWTKRTALWGKFKIPKPIFNSWDDVPKNEMLYVRKGRKCSMAWLHKSALKNIPEFHRFTGKINSDMDLRSLCSQNFAHAFKEVNP